MWKTMYLIYSTKDVGSNNCTYHWSAYSHFIILRPPEVGSYISVIMSSADENGCGWLVITCCLLSGARLRPGSWAALPSAVQHQVGTSVPRILGDLGRNSDMSSSENVIKNRFCFESALPPNSRSPGTLPPLEGGAVPGTWIRKKYPPPLLTWFSVSLSRLLSLFLHSSYHRPLATAGHPLTLHPGQVVSLPVNPANLH
jgi:hypothetical protein